MDESLETFLSRLNLSRYLDNFRVSGVDDLETVVTLSEEEIEKHVGIVLPGHKRKLVLNFEKRLKRPPLVHILRKRTPGEHCRPN